MSDTVLDVDGLWVRYGNVPAVRDLSFHVGAGEIVALLGPNGAGKSSTLSAIMGKLGRQEGSISFNGASIVGRSPDQVARDGIALVPEGRHIFGDLSVKENLRLGTMACPDQEAAAQGLAEALERFPILDEFMGRQAGLLSGGQQQQLAIARALVSKPSLLLLDEPSLGLAPLIVDSVFDALSEVREAGTTILIVEQRATRTAAFADRSYIIANGSLRTTIDADTHDIDEVISSAYFGA